MSPQIHTSENEYGAGEVRSWASIIDENALEQARAISRVPVVQEYVALMPDAHFGFGPPVGSAIRTSGAVMPYAVGVDIGCGMIAVKTDLEREALAGLEGRILGAVRDDIPSGTGMAHARPIDEAHDFFSTHGTPPGIEWGSGIRDGGHLGDRSKLSLVDRARIQFGTLGAGNHFVEVSADEEGTVWCVLHSGSRGIGNILATAHQRAAEAFHAEAGTDLESREFAWFPADESGFRAYLDDMFWAQRYAYGQREAMMTRLLGVIESVTGLIVNEEQRINCHHNYAELQDEGTVLTRKGAIDASEGVAGIIPGSMGADTYIVLGLGNAEAYRTAPHGAGRLRGRRAAKRTLSVEDFRAQMAGRTWQDRDAEALLDEAPDAYKDIHQVLEDSAELVRVEARLAAFINYKGL